jgi:hypothetical protein
MDATLKRKWSVATQREKSMTNEDVLAELLGPKSSELGTEGTLQREEGTLVYVQQTAKRCAEPATHHVLPVVQLEGILPSAPTAAAVGDAGLRMVGVGVRLL